MRARARRRSSPSRPYGLSKGLTAAVVSHRCREFGIRYGKFVIPNPFGAARGAALLRLSHPHLEERRDCAGQYARLMFATISTSRCSRRLTRSSSANRRRERTGQAQPERLCRDARAPSPSASPPPCGRGLEWNVQSSSGFRRIFRSRSCGSTSSQPRDMLADGMKAQPGMRRRRDMPVEQFPGCTRRLQFKTANAGR